MGISWLYGLADLSLWKEVLVAAAKENDWMSIRCGHCEEDKNVLSFAEYQTLVIYPLSRHCTE
jgi:hypothetical protein